MTIHECSKWYQSTGSEICEACKKTQPANAEIFCSATSPEQPALFMCEDCFRTAEDTYQNMLMDVDHHQAECWGGEY